MTVLTRVIQVLISKGADPNELQHEFENAVAETLEWVLWGDDGWRRYMVCSKCGSEHGGICSDDPKVKLDDFHNPSFHSNQLGVIRIPYKEWLKRHPKIKKAKL